MTHLNRQFTVLKFVILHANSPRNAFYKLQIEQIRDGYLVRKESGVNHKVLNREAWFREDLTEAEKLFLRILREKTNPNRRRPRKYVVVETGGDSSLFV